MADIFISYSKPDRDLVLKLSAFLESEGWSVWWDKGLKPADSFRDEIMKQLTAARAVITVWTENSIKSDWVRAEAGRAKSDGKLIPVKTPSLTYADIPLPFGEMHTENVTSTDLIRGAVIAQLAKPTVTPSSFWIATKTLRLQILTWMGIIGGAITMFTHLGGLFKLADWARWVSIHWHGWNQVFWRVIMDWTGLRIPRLLIPILSFSVFTMMVVTGTVLRLADHVFPGGEADDLKRKERKLLRFTKWSLITVVWIAVAVILALVTMETLGKNAGVSFVSVRRTTPPTLASNMRTCTH
jgi:hypothetical protein